MPNMLIASPADDMELRACVRYLIDNPQPSYLRMGRGGEPLIHSTIPEVQPGEMLHIRVVGGDSTVVNISTGTVTPYVLELDGSHFTMPLWGTPAEDYAPRIMNSEIHTYEDHYEGGGFGSWLQEIQGQKIHIHGLDPRVDSVIAKRETILETRFGAKI
jgi:transketolase